MTLDPVTLTVIQNGLRKVASEMDLVHEKPSFSPVISEGFDRSNGIYDRTTGEVVAQGELGLPIFVGVMQFTTQAVIMRRRDLEPGDVILVNDPYLGGTHLMDVKMVRPFYYRDRLWCYLSNTGHWPDTGGMVPGGFSATATEIVQEGLRLPPVKLVRRGEICQDIIDIVLNNIRVADERIGDIRAQLGALSVGEKRLTQMLDGCDVGPIDVAIAELRAGFERLMRAHIDSIPDGTYSATAIVDSDGIVDHPLEVVLDMTVSGSDINFDLSRSSPPCRGPMNSVWATTQSAIYVAMKHIFPDVPINAGCFAPIHIAPPNGTFLYARYPRPVAGCAAEVAQRIMEAVFGAMGKAIPERLFAAPAGTSGNFGLGGYDPEENRHYIMYLFSGGGYGGWWQTDGLTNRCSSVRISKTQPVEILEQHYPIPFDRFALREGSGGAGPDRGRVWIAYRSPLFRRAATGSILIDHGRVGPPGLLAGSPGAVHQHAVSQGGLITSPPHLSQGEGYVLAPGDWIAVKTPGGGGYGPAPERDPAMMERDIARGYYTDE